MATGKHTTFVWVHRSDGDALRAMAEANRNEERAWIAEQRERAGLHPSQPTPEPIRLEALALRPGTWPTQSHLLEAAMRVRLRAPELVGPWTPFTHEEQEAQRLPGRRYGTSKQKFTDKMALDIDPVLIDHAHLAAYRISEPIVAALITENLVGPGASRSRTARQRREELQAQIYTLGRIAREALAIVVGR
ncbi:hypothetical protein [Streptomyces yaizuensis]|uniref:Uncharacterized protein n=1 Tax=Streptomyces yaizuensis TaxID=2989713 RepID=A0AA86M7D6_9ACTN|nr:hypothetical protein [Streptomyces sp. YSPA8]BDT39686.1 hypothetical protein SYYSPA8_37840 [Streptomyces sp. YSPA8]